jgi:uncharacterized membrane protein YphA (DoxX/SURF4 family)
MAAKAASVGHTSAAWVLRVLLGVTFLVIGGGKLTGTLNTVQFFAAIGWGQWFRYLTGLLDVVGAVLLFIPRWTCYGALLLASTVGTATVLCLTIMHRGVTVPLALTLLSATLAWLTRARGAGSWSAARREP